MFEVIIGWFRILLHMQNQQSMALLMGAKTAALNGGPLPVAGFEAPKEFCFF